MKEIQYIPTEWIRPPHQEVYTQLVYFFPKKDEMDFMPVRSTLASLLFFLVAELAAADPRLDGVVVAGSGTTQRTRQYQ
jgi:hypothetical protein